MRACALDFTGFRVRFEALDPSRAMPPNLALSRTSRAVIEVLDVKRAEVGSLRSPISWNA